MRRDGCYTLLEISLSHCQESSPSPQYSEYTGRFQKHMGKLLFKILKLCAGFPLPLTGGVSGRLHISPARHEPGSSATLSLFPLLAVMQLTGKNILF